MSSVSSLFNTGRRVQVEEDTVRFKLCYDNMTPLTPEKNCSVDHSVSQIQELRIRRTQDTVRRSRFVEQVA